MMRDKITSRANRFFLTRSEKFRGFCFITFKEAEIMEKVLKMSHKIEGYSLQLKKAISKNESRQKIVEEKYRKVFILGLHQDAQQRDLQSYFCKFGKIEEVRIIVDKAAKVSKGKFRKKGCLGFRVWLRAF